MGLGTTAASAETIEDVEELAINVSGRIIEHCAIGEIRDMDFGDITRKNLRAKTRAHLSCNLPFEMTIRSANGGLAHESMPKGQGPYAGTLSYTLGVDMAVRRPQRGLVSRRFQSAQLMGGQSFTSEGGIATDGMAVSVSLNPPSADAGLLAGKYGETIEISIAPI
ncbi:MAG: hypothetical protein Pars92KO_30020 [Parasphingorhabdus sp.]